MNPNPHNPLIIQGDSTLLLEVNNELYKDARDAISAFAHLEKSPEYIHTYTITPLSLWNAASLGWNAEKIITVLRQYSKYALPQNVLQDIHEIIGRFGTLQLVKDSTGALVLESQDGRLLGQLCKHHKLSALLGPRLNDRSVSIDAANRGAIKQILIMIGYPVYDKAGYVDGEPFPIDCRSVTTNGIPFTIREYQRCAAESFIGNVNLPGGSGVVVLPCGAGKTIVGIVVMALLKRKTLILVTNVTAVHQWRREILSRTSIQSDDIGEYSGEEKKILPITIATYQILTYRKKKTDPFTHFDIFDRQNWGLIIYDEVHLLPAPVFKFTAQLQARRRLGLTATLIREDGHEKDVFTLIGPKKFDMPWKVLEKQGWIASARCVEIRVNLPHCDTLHYLSLPPKQQIRLAYENPLKITVARELLERHSQDQVLIIGQYLSQIKSFGIEFEVPIITGAMPNKRRDELFDLFRKGTLRMLILSKVGNFALDLPDANVAIQISGTFGSRQEEAQRLGRILRPKKNGEQATFYSIVSRETKELDFAMKRQLFLAEQGYPYDIIYREFS
ncbi:MAG: DEAD/DEAH box helicase [Chitinivibrionales bacterium]|nr:DEAD/DEAH box helicase [Chitinivibrionales bacterium]